MILFAAILGILVIFILMSSLGRYLKRCREEDEMDGWK